ncbi:hypothetical protein HYPSUDRAFT_58270 [Hypholoma sublateritium FD-334 SS-4]|uniref:JmjC domain-containing protein n=1 Tax=Hypholoma sublateritium (strain FD-334 SS-4) TaxID=945553 RepID=A0A0D2NAX0_HYPSF|nr:hypothetical protein HYPSUDRAFT_58270 [Hypholoma sublateritium FD-334 SS-4]
MAEFNFALPGANPKAKATLKIRRANTLTQNKVTGGEKVSEGSGAPAGKYKAKKRHRDQSIGSDQQPAHETNVALGVPLELIDDPMLYRIENYHPIEAHPSSPPPLHTPPAAEIFVQRPPPALIANRMPDPDIMDYFEPFSQLIEARPPSPPPLYPPPTAGVYAQRPPGLIVNEILPDPDVIIDPRSPYAVWGDGKYLTRLPFVPDPIKPECNALKLLSAHLEELVPSVQDAHGTKLVDYYTYANYGSLAALGAQIKSSMAFGRYAVVEGCPDLPKIQLTLSDMAESLHIQPTEQFQVHDSLLREKHHTEPQVVLSISDFIDNLKDPNAIQAIPDSPNGTAQHPLLVGQVSISPILFQDEGYIATDKARKLFTNIPIDMKSSRVGAIKHQPLFHTYIHHDASGMGTWTHISSGNKFWVLAVPNDQNKFLHLNEIHYHNKKFILRTQGRGQHQVYDYPKTTTRYCIYGKAGDIIFQPPNAWHEVFTPCKSITVGGHFYSYDTMHFSDVARYFDVKSSGSVNQHDASAQLIMSAMVTRMPHLGSRVYYRKPLISLCRMILRPHLYLLPNEERDAHLLADLSVYLAEVVGKYGPAESQSRVFKGGDHTRLPTVTKAAILGARIIAHHFNFDLISTDFLFTPIPWYNPGDKLVLTDKVKAEMEHDMLHGTRKYIVFWQCAELWTSRRRHKHGPPVERGLATATHVRRRGRRAARGSRRTAVASTDPARRARKLREAAAAFREQSPIVDKRGMARVLWTCAAQPALSSRRVLRAWWSDLSTPAGSAYMDDERGEGREMGGIHPKGRKAEEMRRLLYEKTEGERVAMSCTRAGVVYSPRMQLDSDSARLLLAERVMHEIHLPIWTSAGIIATHGSFVFVEVPYFAEALKDVREYCDKGRWRWD